MKHKRALGVVGIIFGGLLFLTLILPWFQMGVIIFGNINLYPLWAGNGYNLANSKFSDLSYLSGGFLVAAAIMMVASGIYMTAKDKGNGSNAVMIFGAVLGVVSAIVYMLFIVKISPDSSGNYFYGSTSLYNYGLQLGFYLEAGLSIVLVIMSSIFIL